MSNLEKYLDQVIEQHPGLPEHPIEVLSEPPEQVNGNPLLCVLRRWYIALFIFLVVAGAGIPAVWVLMEPRYVVSGDISVAPVTIDTLTGRADPGDVGSYNEYVNTQAYLMTLDPRVLQGVADDLAGRNLSFFKEPTGVIELIQSKLGIAPVDRNPVEVLKRAISRGMITAGHLRGTHVLRVSMRGLNSSEAIRIVDAFMDNYIRIHASKSSNDQIKTLGDLEKQRTVLVDSLSRRRKQIRDLAEEYGTYAPDGQETMLAHRARALLAQRTTLESRRISLEARVEALQAREVTTPSPEEALSARNAYINADPMVAALTNSVVDADKALIAAQQRYQPGHHELARLRELRDAFRSSLEAKRDELGKQFDESYAERVKEAAVEELAALQAEIETIKTHEARLLSAINLQDLEEREVGRKHLDIEELQFQNELEKDLYDTVTRRIKEVEIEGGQDSRIVLAAPADMRSYDDPRAKYTAAMTFGALGLGCLLAFLRDKADKRLQTPEDVAKYSSLPLIGTTTSSRTIKPALFAEQIAGDYQTIRTNLSLLSAEGMPRKLAITSAGTKEGKTTFAVNLATSMAKSGKRVLLIDGDLRKPDVGFMLNVTNGDKSLCDVLLGEDPDTAIKAIASSGLHVLVSDRRRAAETHDLLGTGAGISRLNKLCAQYDHVVIDTPPILAFPDAVVWATFADGVVLVSYAGQTTAPDLREAKERLARVRARVLGTVLSNVPADHGYNRYVSGYYTQGYDQPARKARRLKKKLLMPVGTADRGSELESP